MTTVAMQLVESDGSGLTLSGAFVFVAVFTAVVTPILAAIDYLRRH